MLPSTLLRDRVGTRIALRKGKATGISERSITYLCPFREEAKITLILIMEGGREENA